MNRGNMTGGISIPQKEVQSAVLRVRWLREQNEGQLIGSTVQGREISLSLFDAFEY